MEELQYPPVAMRMPHKLIVLTCLLSLTIACSGKDSPTAPTPTPASTQTRVMRLEAILDFGDVIVGQSGTRDLRIYNEGNAAMTITGMTIPGGAPLVSSWTSGTIAPGQSQVAVIRYSPTALGTLSGNLTVTGDQTSGANTTPLAGRGVLAPRANFTRNGSGNTVFDMPGDVQRLRIFGRWSGRDTSNFIVTINGRNVVNEILRNATGNTYEGIHLVPLAPRAQNSVVEITNSGAISEWRFTEER